MSVRVETVEEFHKAIIEELRTNSRPLFLRIAGEYGFKQNDPELLSALLDQYDVPTHASDGLGLSTRERLTIYALSKG